MKQKICKFCGKSFIPNSNNQQYCKNPHYRNCPVCGKVYLEDNVENLKRPPVACSYECRAKLTKKTSMVKYGIPAPGNTSEARKKASETMMRNLGVPYAMMSEAVKEKAKITNNMRYGHDNAGSSYEIINKRMKTNRQRYGDILPFNRPESYAKQRATMKQRYGYPHFVMCPRFTELSKYQRISKLNQRISELLNAAGISHELEFRIDYRSAFKIYDFRLSNNILLEINPTFTHTCVPTFLNPSGYNKYYHADKSRIAAHAGYRCIHIFDWDDIDKIIAMLAPNKHIYARNLDIWYINKSYGDSFLKQNHLQGTCKGQLLYLGLVDSNTKQLYQLMTFGRSRYSKRHDVELLRLCTLSGYRVIGGASKLFKFATQNYGLSNIISYCDTSKFTGDVYTKIGMTELRQTPPNKHWSKGSQHITDNLLRQRGFDQLFNTNYGKGTSNEQLMLEHGWLPVYDCGQKVYEYK